MVGLDRCALLAVLVITVTADLCIFAVINLSEGRAHLGPLLGMLGLSAELCGQTLVPIGTVYDPFICPGLDALIYSLYSGAKFIFAGTPSYTGRWKLLRPETRPLPPARLLMTAVRTASFRSLSPEDAPPELISGARPM